MKFLDTINGSIKNFGKGMLAIFAIKLLLFGGVFVSQSCQTDSIEDSTSIEQKLALSKFESLVRTSTPKIQSMVKRQQNLLVSKSKSIKYESEQTENEAKEMLEPIISGAKELLVAFDFTDSDLAEELEDTNDARIAIVGLAILAAKDETSKQTALNFTNVFITSTYAQDVGDTVACVGAGIRTRCF